MQTAEQQANFKQAMISGALRNLVIARGGTGDKRQPLTHKEYDRRKKRVKLAKQSRKANR